MIFYTIAKPDDRRDLDTFVREVYDRVSEIGDHMSRENYASVIRGGANALHKFGMIIVPRVRHEYSSEPHVIELEG